MNMRLLGGGLVAVAVLVVGIWLLAELIGFALSLLAYIILGALLVAAAVGAAFILGKARA